MEGAAGKCIDKIENVQCIEHVPGYRLETVFVRLRRLERCYKGLKQNIVPVYTYIV